MKVLFATSEMAGFVKAGGFGEVSAWLPRASPTGRRLTAHLSDWLCPTPA
ncbi:MAG: glycogen/starch synthase [Acetobacteraceae bacterium]